MDVRQLSRRQGRHPTVRRKSGGAIHPRVFRHRVRVRRVSSDVLSRAVDEAASQLLDAREPTGTSEDRFPGRGLRDSGRMPQRPLGPANRLRLISGVHVAGIY